MTGPFIVLEGLDGAGTTTQAALLARWLREQGHDVLETHEPTDGPVGRILRQSLRGEAEAPTESTLPWLFAADRADHLTRTVEPALERGTWVVSDRYLHSSLAYQSLTLPLSDVLDLNARFRVPDLTLFLDVSVETALGRISGRGRQREIYERRDRLQAIKARYRAVMELLRTRGDTIVELDGSLPVDEVARTVAAKVAPLRVG